MVEFELPPFQQRMAVETRFANLSSGNYTAFNLQKDSSDTNVMMHIRVDPDQLVLNSRSNGAWGSEVRINKAGIGTPGKLVTLKIEARSDHFYITVNGEDHYEFKYRLPYTDINMGAVYSWPLKDTEIKFYSVLYPPQ